MSEEKTKVRYKGKVAVEIGVGHFSQKFPPGEVADIEDPRFRIALIDRGDFELTDAAASKAKSKKGGGTKKAAAAKKSGESAESAATDDSQADATETDDSVAPTGLG